MCKELAEQTPGLDVASSEPGKNQTLGPVPVILTLETETGGSLRLTGQFV